MVKIRNCNCINEADISIKEGALNIKYGANGTGKSTISKAIAAKAKEDEDALNELKPFNSEEFPEVSGLNNKNIKVFDEDYVNSYLFKEDSFLGNSYQVFLRSEECDNLTTHIENLLKQLQGIFQDSEKIKKLTQFIPKYFEAVKYNNGTIPKRGGVKEFIQGNGGGFDKYDELKNYKPYYNRDMSSVAKWAKWRNEGSRQLQGCTCPFCTSTLKKELIVKENDILEKVFKNSALSVASAVLGFIETAIEIGYIKEDAARVLKGYIGDKSKEDELYAELQQLGTETEYLDKKIKKICEFRPMNVSREQLDEIEKTLGDMIIEQRHISKFYDTDFINILVKEIQCRIDDLKDKTSILKGLFIQHQEKMKKLILNREKDINDFLSLAGFPYKFVLKSNGDKNAYTYLVPIKDAAENRIHKIETHLSWGEKNAFSLVMFMYEAISEDADLIVLDDPITSFDKDKKFAVIHRLFDNQKEVSFRGRTVIMLTHELQPVIDYVYNDFFSRWGLVTPVNTMYLQNEDGKLYEWKIKKDDLKNIVQLTEDIAKDESQELVVRVVNLRKYIELTDAAFKNKPEYEILSNIIHGRAVAEDKEGNKLDESIIVAGCEYLQKYIPLSRYSQYIDQLRDSNLLALMATADPYVKVIAIRFLFERHKELLTKLRKKYPATCKFVNETNHVENDYIFQLNPIAFCEIPECYRNQLYDFLQNDSGLL